MCLGSSPSVPPPPPPPQASQPADTATAMRAKRQQTGMAGGTNSATMLTGTGGVPNSQLNVGRPSLLGQ